MNRIDEIKRDITDAFTANSDVIKAYGLDRNKTFAEQFSSASLESILFYNDAYRALLIEKLIEHNLELMDEKIRTQRAHTLGWYRQTALNFQYGGHFFDDITEYDNTGLTDEQIAAQRIVTKCSVSVDTGINRPTITVKVHKADGKLNDSEMSAFENYIGAKADAGVTVNVVSQDADVLQLWITIRTDSTPLNREALPEAVRAHLRSLPFNGAFFPSLLQQALMQHPGVRVATVTTARAGAGVAILQQIQDSYLPVSGAIVINDNDLHIIYERI